MGDKGNNVIYFDPYFKDRKEEIYRDSEEFKLITSGAFILSMRIKTFKVICEDIKNLEVYAHVKFDLILASHDDPKDGEEIMDFIENNNYSVLFKRACIYTYYPKKYSFFLKKYKLIKNVFFLPHEVRDFIKEGNYSTDILRTLKLVTLDDYELKFDKLEIYLAKHYGDTSLNSFNREIEKVKSFLNNPGYYTLKIKCFENLSKKESILKALELYKNIEKNYKEIINNYTQEIGSIYKDFNYLLLRLNWKGIEAFSWFMAGLVFSLNLYFINSSQKYLSGTPILYKGTKLDSVEVLNYERMEGRIITFPQFTSTSISQEVAANFAGRERKFTTRQKEGKFGVLFTIYGYNKGNSINGVDVMEISEFPKEKEILLLPFSFFKIRKVNVDFDKFEALIDLEFCTSELSIQEKLNKVINKSLDFYGDFSYKFPENKIPEEKTQNEESNKSSWFKCSIF